MTNNDYILDAIRGEPNSLTSIAFYTGEIMERERIIKLLKKSDSVCNEWAIALIKGETK